MIDYYEIRYLSKSDRSIEKMFSSDANSKTLYEYVFDYEKIVILGNPGIGKTTELKKLFNTLWDEHQDSGIIPFYINLKYFRSTDNFEDLIIYEDWRNLSSIIFILDGLDEIVDIQDFLSAFEMFISKKSQFNYKYVVSCRTNIYEKFLIKITDFQTLFLDNLSYNQAERILSSKFTIDIKSLKINSNHNNYLQTPFFLNLFADYYKTKGHMPSSDSEIWDLYIQETIEVQKKKSLKRGVLKKPIFERELKKVAFVNELMQKNYIDESEIERILGDDYDLFLENPFLVYNSELKNFSFLHRQIQEYFVAKTFLEMPFENTLQLVKIDEIAKIHPSFYNSITFLLNLYDSKNENYLKLIQWIENNQIELFFRADSDRISDELRSKIFVEYFDRECVQKTFWITKSKNFSIDEIAKFAECKSNFEYLMSIINNQQYNDRIIISAIEVINHFENKNRFEIIEESFKNLLLNPVVKSNIKSHILRAVEEMGLSNFSSKLLKDIFDYFKDNDADEISSSLLSLIYNLDNIDEFFDFIYKEFLLDNNITKRVDKDNIVSGRKYRLQELILRLNNTENFLEIVIFYFDDRHYIEMDNQFSKEVLERMNYFLEKNLNFMSSFFQKIIPVSNFYFDENFLANWVITNNSQDLIFKYILNSTEFNKSRSFLAKIATSQNINLILEKFELKEISDLLEIEWFRNVIANLNSEALALQFTAIFEEKGYLLKPFLTKDEYKIIESKYKESLQSNLYKLFDAEALRLIIENFFEVNNTNEVNSKNILDIESKWYEENGHWRQIDDLAINVLRVLIHKFGIVSLDNAVSEIKKEEFRFELLRRTIIRYDERRHSFILDDKQKEIINDWTMKCSNLINFDNIITLTTHNSYRQGREFLIFKNVIFFTERFDIPLSKSFWLKSIEFYDIVKENYDYDNFKKLTSYISDQVKFKDQIISNILNKTLFLNVLSNHISYALEYELNETYKMIRELFLREESIYNEEEKFTLYFEKSGDTDLLIECCKDYHKRICWSAIKILSSNNLKTEFIVSVAKQYLFDHHKSFFQNALNILLENNIKEAVDFILLYLQEVDYISIRSTYYQDYNNIENIERTEEMFYRFYIDYGNDRFSGYECRAFFERYIINVSKTNEDNFKRIKQILSKIKLQLQGSNNDLFYINDLIDMSEDSYNNSRIKPLNIEQAINHANLIL